MAKNRKALPLLTIFDDQDLSRVTYINRGYVRTALQGLLIVTLNKGDVATEIQKLLDEIDKKETP